MSKKYAVVIDISPSEQISGNPAEVKTMAMVFGLYDIRSFDRVGSGFGDENARLDLKKWAGSSNVYKEKFVDHLEAVVCNKEIICGINQSNETVILDIGATVFQELHGKFPEPSSVNKKGKDRITLGGYKVDGKAVDLFEVLKDDLCILGWMTESLASALKLLDEINGEEVKLDVLIDRLPNEQGGDDYYKATLLKQMLHKATNGRVHVAGVPDVNVVMQRDIFVDNIAGLMSEVCNKPTSKLSENVQNRKTNLIPLYRRIIK